jgi:coproporphyrinogen III oxidase-like Fe-S oxidoreductase
MIGTPRELALRLEQVTRALALSSEPLHVPLGVVFRPESGESHMRAWADHAARAARGEAFAPATLYVHVPFCARVCTYCLLSAVRIPGKDVVQAYVIALRQQMAMFEPVVRDLRFGSIHVGGGTPTILDERALDDLFSDLARLPRSEGALIGVEAHPATSTPGRLRVLKEHGVHRLSFGVESMTPGVLQNVNREDQNEARVRAAVAEARRLGFSINVDLLAGLPGETAESWRETVQKTLSLEPDSLSVNRFLGENSPLAAFGYGPDEAENRRADAMLMDADRAIREGAPPRWPEEPLTRPGFGTQYVWDRSSDARRYFQDDMIGPVSTLAIGAGALGHVYGRGFSIPRGSVADYVASLSRGEPPEMMVAPIDERFEKAFFAADQACRGSLSRQAWRRIFGRDIAEDLGKELSFLIQRGLITGSGDRLSKPPSLEFQVMHLLAFLLRDGASLAREVRALETASLPRAPREGEVVDLSRGADLDAVLARLADQGSLRVDVGDGLDGETATRLATLARRADKQGISIEVEGADRRALREYDHVRAEMPPSMLWVRIAIRASQASRGEQRLLVARR